MQKWCWRLPPTPFLSTVCGLPGKTGFLRKGNEKVWCTISIVFQPLVWLKKTTKAEGLKKDIRFLHRKENIFLR
ncbi:MAG: hypothetical protein Q4C55_06370, partial [Eubacterium sp.]|nr:hypothetical protein [Eubacterium sp.]